VLTPLQRQVAEIIAGLKAAEGFGLAGGAALIVRGDVDRRTQDLDFFGLQQSDVHRLLPEAEKALEAAGFQVRRVREGTGFVRLAVERGAEVTEVDLAADARLFPLEVQSGLPMLNSTELAVDKVLAIFGRAEAPDFVDLSAVVDHHGLEALFRLAAEKDPGFSIDVFSEMLHRFDRLRQDEFGIETSAYQTLAATVKRWREMSLELGRSLGPELGRDHGRGL
jgi:Nucleotidyl transferase AbiEii toxin, Type IV TA system